MKTSKKNFILIAFLVIAVFACKKSANLTDNQTAKINYVSKEQSYNVLKDFVTQNKKQATGGPISQSVTSSSAIAVDSLKSYITNKFGSSYLNNVYEPVKSKIQAINLKFPASSSPSTVVNSMHVSKLGTNDLSNLDTDVGVINNAFSNSVLQDMGVSPELTNSVQSLNNDINTVSQNYLQTRYMADSTNTNLGNTSDFTNSISNIILQHANYPDYSLTSTEQLTYSVALLTLNDQVQNNLGPQLQQTLESFSIHSKIQINGFFSWLKQNVLAPIVTFVVKTGLFVALVIGAMVVASAAAVFGDYDLVVGAITGLGAFAAVSDTVNTFLNNAGLYDPSVDIAHFV